MKTYILSLLLIASPAVAWAKDSLFMQRAKITYIQEYTYLGIQECFKKENEKVNVAAKKDKDNVAIESDEYFDLLKKCFKKTAQSCQGKKESKECQNYQEMKKRVAALDQVERTGKMMELGEPIKPIIKQKLVVKSDLKVKTFFEGGPNVTEMSDFDLLKEGNTPDQVEKARKKYKKILELKNKIVGTPYSLTCQSDRDCTSIGLGHRLCGGAESILNISILTPQFEKLKSTISQFNNLVVDYQNGLKGFSSICSIEGQAPLKCHKGKCMPKK